MSLQSFRDDLVAAADGVAGVRVTAKPPRALVPLVAWPRLTDLQRGPGRDFEMSWEIIIILSGDEFTAMTQIETIADELPDAIEPVAYVDSMTPTMLEVQGGDSLYALRILVRSES